MKRNSIYNRRLFAWLLALTLLFVALPSGASWQCLNGTPCPLNCPLLRHNGKTAPTCTTVAHASHCAKCHVAPVPSVVTEAVAHCPSSQCVLRVQAKPDADLTHKTLFVLPLLALPPPVQQFAVPSVETTAVSFPIPLVFIPQRFLRPYLGRAPPVFL